MIHINIYSNTEPKICSCNAHYITLGYLYDTTLVKWFQRLTTIFSVFQGVLYPPFTSIWLKTPDREMSTLVVLPVATCKYPSLQPVTGVSLLFDFSETSEISGIWDNECIFVLGGSWQSGFVTLVGFCSKFPKSLSLSYTTTHAFILTSSLALLAVKFTSSSYSNW